MKNKQEIILWLGVVLVIVGIIFVFQPSESSIPPTPAFKIINTTTGNVTASMYNDFITFIEGSGITISPNYSTNELTFSASGSGLSEQYCTGTDKFRAYNATLNSFICATDETTAGGDATTASNVGGGNEVFQTEVGDDLRFRTLINGSGIIITQNTNDLNINTSFFANTVTCSGDDKLSAYNNATGTFTCSTDQTGSGGEANTASNIGTGSLKLFHSKSGVDLRFKTITNGQGITVTNGTNTGTIATSFIVNSQTCSGTDKVSAINVATGTVTCSTDQTGGGGIDVKSGSESVTEGSCTSVSFNTSFSSTPVAVGNVINSGENNVISITSLATTGFDLCMQKVGGGGASTYTVYWIATNAGNP